ncbi:methyl-accepting chemotaxis protein [Nitrincola tapanii]|uniref:PAS domain S-box protein n=1 Tax=Nitrincola tapanii TaxID=1708751 RepID=A0A5A9W5R9_9GAMM|nr:PAS domain-containing methyl-accepting chemotaxis protein [Nitrincola tapanii]KAA0875794.1 PAS domain S-box protein [Nitrincola tapanii]
MKASAHLTGVERTFAEDQQLISSTDKRGIIRYCNEEFVRISGYSREELLGQPHNIVRHPDMPKEAYASMWSYIQSGRPWMGIVKNRCKNGDHYWVDAYITPIFQQGEVVGYESVRRKPKREDVERAENLYAKVLAGQSTRQWRLPTGVLWSGAGLFLAAGLAAPLSLGLALPGWLWALLGAGIGSGMMGLFYRQRMSALAELMPHAFMDALAMKVYTDEAGSFGKMKMAIISDAAHLNTVITRLEHAAQDVAIQASEAHVLSVQSSQGVKDQQVETEQVAAAMHQMSATINEVSGHVQETASRTDSVDKLAKQGSQIAHDTLAAIQQLQQRVNMIAIAVAELSEESRTIAGTTALIEQIAEQTNLLALNAAIESARAGEHGRGFAVVADEVRQLALRTRDSTQQIHSIVNNLQAKAERALEVASVGEQEAERGAHEVEKTEEMLREIADSISRIAGMTVQMAAAIEEQASVSDGVNHQVSNINQLASSSLEKGMASSERSKQLEVTAEHLYELVERFRR